MVGLQGHQLAALAQGQALVAFRQRPTAHEAPPEVRPVRGPAPLAEQPGRMAPRRAGRAAPELREERRGPPAGAPRQSPSAAHEYRPASFAGAVLAQILSQGETATTGTSAALPVSGRQAELGNEAYRRAGGEPPLYSEAPSLFRIAV